MDSSIYHNVPVLIQPQSWACWYTSLQMVVRYYRSRGKGKGLIDPSEDPETSKLFADNAGIGDTATKKDERERIARKLGFTVAYVSLIAEGMWELLKRGPVLYAGRWPNMAAGHWVVIVGISEKTLAINNPASGLQTWDYNFFMGQYLQQTKERPLVYVP